MRFPSDNQAAGPRRIDMTPMIDVVFLLVIFWMVVTSIASPTADRSVAPPASRLATRNLAGQRLVLQVRTGSGAVYGFRSQRYELGSLVRRLRMLTVRGREGGPVLARPVLIRADGAADSRHVTQLLGVLRRLGVRRVDFAARLP